MSSSVTQVAVVAACAISLEMATRSVAAAPFALQGSDVAFLALFYGACAVPALLCSVTKRFRSLPAILVGAPFALSVVNLAFALGRGSGRTVGALALAGLFAGGLIARFTRARTLAACAALSLLVAGMNTRTVSNSPADTGRLPNVLLIVLDTAGASHLSVYDRERKTSENLRQLANRGVTYQRALATAPWTLPSHASLFSGLYPSELGFDGVGFERTVAVGSIAQDLQAAGWEAHAISANPIIPGTAILRAGFRSVWDVQRLIQPFPLRVLDRVRKREGFQSRGHRVTALALDWIDRLAPTDRPWFLFLNYLDPHAPYRPPERERQSFAPGIDPEMLSEDTQQYNSGSLELTDEIRDAMRALYHGEIAAMDSAVGRLFDGLETRGYGTANCFIIITADHGESLGEDGFVGHLLGLPDSVLHVPLLILGPGIAPDRIDAPVQLVQLRATVRNLLGLPALPNIAPALPPWGSTLELLIAEHPEPTWYLHELRDFRHDAGVESWRGNWVAVQRDGMKVVFDDRGRGHSYDLRADPGEQSPLPRDRGGALIEAYAAWRGAGRAVRGAQPNEDHRRPLEAIGYIR